MDTSIPEPHVENHPAARNWTRYIGWVVVFALVFVLLWMVAAGMVRNNEGPLAIGDPVPEFVFTTFAGEEILLSDMRGQVVVLNFWASWCTTCYQEAADLQTAWELYRPSGEVVFLGSDYVDTEPEALKYISNYGITYINGPDLGTRLSQAFKIRAVPETYIIDQEGRLAYAKIGPFQNLTEIRGAIEPLLAP